MRRAIRASFSAVDPAERPAKGASSTNEGRRSSRFAAPALALLLAGCSVLPAGEPVQVHEYDLAAGAPATGPTRGDGPALQLEPFGVDPALDRDGLLWRRGEVEVGSYALHRWARRPQDGLREVVAAALQAARPEARVATEPPLDAPAWTLTAHVARCEELDEGARWSGAVELRVVLIARDGGEALRRTYVALEPAAARNAPGVVEALRRASARIAAQVAADVGEVLSAAKGP